MKDKFPLHALIIQIMVFMDNDRPSYGISILF